MGWNLMHEYPTIGSRRNRRIIVEQAEMNDEYVLICQYVVWFNADKLASLAVRKESHL